ncbi:hypothetical protein Nepgr_021335 [Nepenthes gracilis]|uniref:Secreted protein n=1 Tax=Nepenthes gracilis TaxID=150966 RepID=A0AAD3SYG8_NEPGR|nr:hypothetical protein Nepgr_021335 [Nepenthes gracilis]
MAPSDQLFNLLLKGLAVLCGVSGRSMKIVVLGRISSLRLLKWFGYLRNFSPRICMRTFECISVKGVKQMGSWERTRLFCPVRTFCLVGFLNCGVSLGDRFRFSKCLRVLMCQVPEEFSMRQRRDETA